MKAKQLLTFTGMGLLMAISPMAMAQTVTAPRFPSPAAEVSQTIGLSKVTINYSRPSVRGREIWGNVVPFGMNNLGFGTAKESPWRAGANENTTITFSDQVGIGGTKINPGTYGLHLEMKEGGGATLILSSNSASWGSFFYDPEEDVVKTDVQTEEIAHVETLQYVFSNPTQTSVVAAVEWEKLRVPFTIEFDTHNLVLESIKNELRNTAGFGWQGPASAAQYCLANNIELDQAIIWAEQSINAQSNVNNLMLKSNILAKQGKDAESVAAVKVALAHNTASINNFYAYGRQLIGAHKADDAMEIFMDASKKWPDHWLAPHGLARAYSAKGDFKKALKYEEEAYAEAPAGSKGFLEGYLKSLKEGKDFN